MFLRHASAKAAHLSRPCCANDAISLPLRRRLPLLGTPPRRSATYPVNSLKPNGDQLRWTPFPFPSRACSRPLDEISFISMGTLLTVQPSTDPPSLALAFSIMLGLPMALWAYKCIMLVVFQRKVIYMGYVPPGARTEALDPKDPALCGMKIEEVEIESETGVKLHGIIAETTPSKKMPTTLDESRDVIMYLQGAFAHLCNAGNPLGRLPVFKTLIQSRQRAGSKPLTIVAIAPRSYWRSANRTPTEIGLLNDYRATLSYILHRWATPSSAESAAAIHVYGHSLGGSIAICLLATLQESKFQRVKSLVVENAFTSIPAMVRTLYPNRYLPYHHLGPFVFDKWDSIEAMKRSADSGSLLELLTKRGKVMVINSELDEVVPPVMGQQLAEDMWKKSGHSPERLLVKRALHEDAWKYSVWSESLLRFWQNS